MVFLWGGTAGIGSSRFSTLFLGTGGWGGFFLRWYRRLGRSHFTAVLLVGQPESAFEAAPGQNFFAVAGFHPLAKAVLLFAGKLFGLVGSLHYMVPPFGGKVCGFWPGLKRSTIISQKVGVVKRRELCLPVRFSAGLVRGLACSGRSAIAR